MKRIIWVDLQENGYFWCGYINHKKISYMNTRSIIYEFAILEHAAYFCVGYIKRCCIKVLLVRSGMNPKRCFISFLSVFLYADVWVRYMEPKITLFPNIKFGAELTLEILKLRTKDLSEPNLICRRSWPSYRTYILRRSNLGRTSIILVPKFSCRSSPVPNIGSHKYHDLC